MIKTITANELKKGLENGEVLLIDVREPAEYKTECINGSCLIPLSKLSIDNLPSKSRPIVIHCSSGRRSEEACKKLLAQDPTLNVYTLEGGIAAWKKAGCAIEISGRNVLPLDRQVQFSAGFLTFACLLLGIFINSWFYVLPGFIGLGLMFAGLSGWCGMARLLAKMPWNN